MIEVEEWKINETKQFLISSHSFVSLTQSFLIGVSLHFSITLSIS